MSVVVTVVAFLLLSLKSGMLFAQTGGKCEGEKCTFQKPTVTWVRPPELGLEGNGVSITAGPLYDVMAYLSTYLNGYEHKFEVYPVKRAWSLVRNTHSSENMFFLDKIAS